MKPYSIGAFVQDIFHPIKTVNLFFWILVFLQKQHIFNNVWFWILYCTLVAKVFWLFSQQFGHVMSYELPSGYVLLSLSRFDFYSYMAVVKLFVKLYALLFIDWQEQYFSLWNLNFN